MLSFAVNPTNGETGSSASSPDYASLAGRNETGDRSDNASGTAPQVRRGIYRGMPVTYLVTHGKFIFQGDIVLEKVDPVDSQGPLSPGGPDSISIDYAQYLWPKVGGQYQVPYLIAAGSGNVTNLNNAITQFNRTFSTIKFVARTTQADYVNFYFDPNYNNAQCEANVGRVGGAQQVGGAGGSVNPCTVSTLLHEMGHVIGLWHEQSRPDRNTYISVNYGNVIKGSFYNYTQLYDNAQEPTLFDYASVMEYPAFAFSRNGAPVIESIPAGIPLSNLSGYSAADIDGIERLYASAPNAVTVTSNPPGLQVMVDGLTVTTPQVFSWTLNSVHSLGIPTGVQSQAGNIVNSNTPTTFYYTYGRWNDSAVASHSITVLPGNGDLATPATSPAITTYTANFIQLVPYAATVFPAATGTVVPSPVPQSYPGSALVFYTARQQATLTANPNGGQNFYEFNNAPYWLPGGLGANPKTFYVPDTGLTVNATAEFSPNPVYTVNVAPNPFSSNLYIYADGNFSYAPKNFSSFYDPGWTANSTHTLRVDSPEYPYSFNSRYAFHNWSDGTLTTTDTVILPATSTTYTATLTPQFFVTDYVNESCAGSINVTPGSPTGDGFYPTASVLTFAETPNSGWLFAGWQYDLSGTSNSQPLTVTDEVLVTADYNTVVTPLTLSSLSPSRAVAGGGGFTLTLNGTGFTPSSVVSVNGAFPAVTFINSTQLSVAVTATQIATPGAFQVWVDNFPSGAICAAFAALPFTVASPAAPQLTSAVSRLTHPGVGAFDVNMPLTGTSGVEDRSSSSYSIVLTFANGPITSGTATVTSGTGAAGTPTFNGNTMTVPLTGVANAQVVNLTVNNVNGLLASAGVNLGFLIGDTNADRSVNSADVGQTKSQSGNLVTGANFREDANIDGNLNSGDVGLVKSKSGTALP